MWSRSYFRKKILYVVCKKKKFILKMDFTKDFLVLLHRRGFSDLFSLTCSWFALTAYGRDPPVNDSQIRLGKSKNLNRKSQKSQIPRNLPCANRMWRCTHQIIVWNLIFQEKSSGAWAKCFHVTKRISESGIVIIPFLYNLHGTLFLKKRSGQQTPHEYPQCLYSCCPVCLCIRV
jgi:hypothetical protein